MSLGSLWKLTVPLFAVSAILGGVSYQLQLIGAADLPATVLYPFLTGETIVFSALTGVLIFRDKLSKALVVSVVICFLGTLMFL